MKNVQISSRLKAAAAAILVIAAAIAIIWLTAPQALILQDAQSGKKIAAYALQDGETFSVTFVHSVNQSPVTEVYCAHDGALYVTQCIYSTLGAGVASTLEPGWTLTQNGDGTWTLSGLDTRMNDLVYIVGTVSDHVLRIGTRTISLRTLCGRNAHVRFSLSRCPFAQR